MQLLLPACQQELRQTEKDFPDASQVSLHKSDAINLCYQEVLEMPSLYMHSLYRLNRL
jgi:hypothetical protein